MQEEVPIDRPNHFLNRSGPHGDVNNGTRGKFNEAQTEERTKLHARSIATKFPSMPQMLQIYKEKFNIDISLESEKQWRKTNWDMIQKKKQEMISTGDLEVTTIGVKALADSVQTLVIDSSKSLVLMRKKLHTYLEKLDDDPAVLKGKTRGALVNKNLEKFIAISEAMAKLSTSLVKQISTLADISAHARAFNKEKDEEDFKEESYKANKEFDPSDVTISEEDRKLLE